MNASRLAPRLILLAAAALLALAVWWAVAAWRDWQRGFDPETVVAASLQGLREQNVLVPFTARYVAVVTSSQSRLGFAAKKTLIMPGTVRYELDLGTLRQTDLKWDAAANALTVTLPPLRLAEGAARAAIEQSFAMPLKAAGIDARVTARFRE